MTARTANPVLNMQAREALQEDLLRMPRHTIVVVSAHAGAVGDGRYPAQPADGATP